MYKLVFTTLLLTLTIYPEGQVTVKPLNQDIDTPQQTESKKSEEVLELPKYLLSTTRISKETESLLLKHNKIIDNLIESDAKTNSLIMDILKWESEQIRQTKGKMDTLFENAEKLPVSNELRKKVLAQAKITSSLINELSLSRQQLRLQRASEEKKWALEASIEMVKKLEEKTKILESQLKLATPLEKKSTPGQTLSDEDVQYYTVKKERTLQSIAWEFYNDNEKWVLIYDYPGNQDKISERAAKALIKPGISLTIPNLDTEEE